MLLTGRRIGAEEALRFGLVNEVVAPDGTRRRRRALGRGHSRLRAAVAARDQADGQSGRRSLSPQQAQTLRLPALVEALQSEDQHEGVRAFQEKAHAGLEGEVAGLAQCPIRFTFQ